MKQGFLFLPILFIYILITPGFQCGDDPPLCDTYSNDSIPLPIEITNIYQSFHVLDTIKMSSVISDTFKSKKGVDLIYPCYTMYASIQPYKVVNNGAGPELNYANIQFNPMVTEGYFQLTSNTGINFLYNRSDPYNRLKPMLVAGEAGLYLMTIGINNYYYSNMFFDSRNPCSQYFGYTNISSTEQQRQFWDSIGTTTLRLAGSNGQVVANKQDRNYFFVKIEP